MSQFIIRDWAGNKMNFGTFKTFEDAWGFLYERFDHLPEAEFDAQMDEFYVEVES